MSNSVNYLGCLLIGLFLSSCSASNQTPTPIGTTTAPVNVSNPTQTFDPAGQTLLASGTFVNGGRYTTKGTAKVYEKNGKRTLLLEDFTTDGGPDLRIYLADGTTFTSFVEVVSKLSATGNFFVEIPAGYDPAKHGFVLIWCKQFSALFGSATLKK